MNLSRKKTREISPAIQLAPQIYSTTHINLDVCNRLSFQLLTFLFFHSVTHFLAFLDDPVGLIVRNYYPYNVQHYSFLFRWMVHCIIFIEIFRVNAWILIESVIRYISFSPPTLEMCYTWMFLPMLIHATMVNHSCILLLTNRIYFIDKWMIPEVCLYILKFKRFSFITNIFRLNALILRA